MKDFLEKLKRFSWLSLPLCFLGFVFLDYAFRFFYRFVGNTALLAPKPMLFTLGWSLLLTALISMLPRLGRRIAMGVVGFFFAALALTHAILYNIFGHLFSFTDIGFAGEGAKFFSFSYFALRKAFLLCLLLYALIMALAIFLAERPKKGKGRWKTELIALALAAVAVIPIVRTHSAMLPDKDRGIWWGATYDPNSEPELYKEFTDPNRCMMMTGLYQYTFRNVTLSLGIGEDRQSVEKLDEYFAARSEKLAAQGESPYAGALKGKNLVMVMLESMDTWLVTPEYMPNLCGLREKSIDVEQFYTPLFLTAGTFNTEIISQTGMIPSVAGLPASAYSTNSFPLSLGHLFEKAGYTANSFHSASPSIYSRGSVHENLGFEAYHNYVAMNMDEYQLDSQMIRGYDQMVVKNAPFFTYIITYSGHGPYTEEMGKIAEQHLDEAKAAVAKSGVTGSEKDMDEYTRAVAHAMETDQFIGEFLEKLEADGLLENTALLFYADHYGKYMTDKEFLHKIKGVTSADPVELYRTPCIFWDCGVLPDDVKPACSSSVDLVPTVVSLFGLDADPAYYAGRDLFSGQPGVVPFPNYAWFDGETYYSADYHGEVTPEMTAVTADVKERIDASDDALKCDYFKHWEK